MAEFAKPMVTIELDEYNGMKNEIKALKTTDYNEEKEFLLAAVLECLRRNPANSPALDNINHASSKYGLMYMVNGLRDGKISLVNKTNK